MDPKPETGSSRGDAGTRTTTASDDTGRAAPSRLDAGGHEPAPPSEDPVTQEARDGIQHEFDTLEATVSSDAVWDEASRRADEEPAPGVSTDAAASETPSGDASAGSSGTA